MPEPVASNPDPVTTIGRPCSSPDGVIPPMPFSSPDMATPPMPFSSSERAVPPMPSEVTNGRDRAQRPAAGGMWHTVMTGLRKSVHRTSQS